VTTPPTIVRIYEPDPKRQVSALLVLLQAGSASAAELAPTSELSRGTASAAVITAADDSAPDDAAA
jgi:hypothetical protein